MSAAESETKVQTKLSARFWLEAGLALLSAALFTLTLLVRDWIEVVFRVDPDHHSGLLEWLIVGSLFLSTIALTALARSNWRSADATT